MKGSFVKMKEKISNAQILAESAIMVALSIAIFAVSDLLPWPFAYGGGFSIFGQVPIVIVSYRHGIKKGLSASTVLALFEMMMGYKNFSYVTGIAAYLIVAFADYIVAFGCLGIAGIFKNKFGGRQSAEMVAGGALVCVIRFLCHFVSGVTIWGGYCPQGMAVGIYSLVYNGAYMLVELILTVIGCAAAGKMFDLSKKKII